MKKITFFVFSFFLLTLLSGCIHTQISADVMAAEDESEMNHYRPSINIFVLHELDDLVFISLSDIYPLSEDPDSIAIHDMTGNGLVAEKYTLEPVYREKFLSATGISETDFVYIYDYSRKNLVSFAVKDLKAIARLNPYANSAKRPFPQYDYMIGFEVDKKSLDRLEDNFWNAFVYVGQENPFTDKPLIPLVWNRIASQKYPPTSETQDKTTFPNIAAYANSRGNTYLAEAEGFQYFLQDYMSGNEVGARRLLVVEPQTQEIIIDKVFYHGESTFPTPLNYRDVDGRISYWDEDGRVSQLTGKLFKNKPPVVFGFLSHSFGCPFISVIDPSNEDITIHCDNRH